MKNLLMLCALFILAGVVVFHLTTIHVGMKPVPAALPNAPTGTWLTDYPAAKQQAARQNKRLLLDFSDSEACYPCQCLNREVWETGEFGDFAADYVLVRLEFPFRTKLPPDLAQQNYELGQQFSVTIFPTVIELDSSGHEIMRQTGYSIGTGAVAYLAGFR
jgi:thioredoxin-related protein